MENPIDVGKRIGKNIMFGRKYYNMSFKMLVSDWEMEIFLEYFKKEYL